MYMQCDSFLLWGNKGVLDNSLAVVTGQIHIASAFGNGVTKKVNHT